MRDVIIALGLVVGVSWAPVFRKSIAAAAHGYTHPRAVQLALTLGLVALLLPAWKRCGWARNGLKWPEMRRKVAAHGLF